MSQHDFDIADAPGASVRSDLNNAFEALVTNNSGPAEPSAMFANMWWFDTANNILKQRSEANDAWVNVALKDGNGWTPYRQGTQVGTAALLTTDTDTALAANSDTKVATQKATKAYADSVQTSASSKISKTIAGEISAMTEKTAIVADDLVVIEDSEASNAKKKAKVSNIVNLSPSLSNVIHSWRGIDNFTTTPADGEAAKVTNAVAQNPANTGGGNEIIACLVFNNANQTLIYPSFKWTKIAGVNTLTVFTRAWGSFGGPTTAFTLRINIGAGAVTGDSVAITGTTPAWITAFTADVSGLVDGTVYEIFLSRANNNASGTGNSWLSAFIIEAS